jgi:hypothetical protein
MLINVEHAVIRVPTSVWTLLFEALDPTERFVEANAPQETLVLMTFSGRKIVFQNERTD